MGVPAHRGSGNAYDAFRFFSKSGENSSPPIVVVVTVGGLKRREFGGFASYILGYKLLS